MTDYLTLQGKQLREWMSPKDNSSEVRPKPLQESEAQAWRACWLHRVLPDLPSKLLRPSQPITAHYYIQAVNPQRHPSLFCPFFGTGQERPDSTERSFFLRIFSFQGCHNPGDYNLPMARGWESKSVEAQQAEAETKAAPAGRPLTAADAARRREKENLRLARERVLQQIAATPNPRRRTQLEEALADLDEKLRSR